MFKKAYKINHKAIKKSLFIALIIAFSISCSQNNAEIHWEVYDNALSYNDASTAIMALHQIKALEPYNEEVNDTLANIYFKAGMYQSSLKIAKEVLSSKPNHLKITLIAGESANKLGAVDQAIEYYEKWLTQNPEDIAVLYSTAVNYFSLNQNSKEKPHSGKIKEYLGKIVSLPQSREIGLPFAVNESQNQLISYYGAALNVLGYLKMEEGSYQEAKNYFDEALKNDPEFSLAKNNRTLLNQLISRNG